MDDDSSPTDDDVLRELTAHGHSIRDYALLTGEDLLAFTFVAGHHGGVMALVIEDDRLARASVAFLRRHGAPEFGTLQEVARYLDKDGRVP